LGRGVEKIIPFIYTSNSADRLMNYHTGLTLRIYLRHILQYKWSFFGLLLFVVVGSAVGVIIPLYYKQFFDTLSDPSIAAVRERLVTVLFAIAALHTAEVILWRGAGFVNNYFEPYVTAAIGNYCFGYLHRHSFSFFSGHFVGALVRRVNKFTGSFERILDRCVWNILQLVVNVAVILFVLSSRDRRLMVIVLVWTILFSLINWFITGYKMKYDVRRSEAETRANGILADTITNNVNVKLFNGYARERSLYAQALFVVRRLRKFTWDLDVMFETVQATLMVALEIGIFYFAIGLWENGTLTVGDFVLIQSYLLTIFLRVWDFGKIIRDIFTDLADAEDMAVVLDTPHEIQDIPHARPLAVKGGNILFKDVSFYYHSTRPIITHFNLHIRPHERLALVGPSGAGKSTLVKLLMRMHDITDGKVFIDEQEIRKVTQESLWQGISFVPQEPILFHRTLMENIRYGAPEATDDQVMAAAQKAHCHEFIRDFPEGYQTFVGERGVKLSGGERQRVAIARAILRNAPILILDEATSSLDSESERLIQAALDMLMKKKTVIVIAHRLSTIMKMDRIVVIDRGQITEEGTHAELIRKRSGLYHKLWSLQAGGFLQ